MNKVHKNLASNDANNKELENFIPKGEFLFLFRKWKDLATLKFSSKNN